MWEFSIYILTGFQELKSWLDKGERHVGIQFSHSDRILEAKILAR